MNKGDLARGEPLEFTGEKVEPSQRKSPGLRQDRPPIEGPIFDLEDEEGLDYFNRYIAGDR